MHVEWNEKKGDNFWSCVTEDRYYGYMKSFEQTEQVRSLRSIQIKSEFMK